LGRNPDANRERAAKVGRFPERAQDQHAAVRAPDTHLGPAVTDQPRDVDIDDRHIWAVLHRARNDHAAIGHVGDNLDVLLEAKQAVSWSRCDAAGRSCIS
jgi:hypothetical protein